MTLIKTNVEIKNCEDLSYPIYTGENLLENIKEYFSDYSCAKKFLVVTNETVYPLYSKYFNFDNFYFCILSDGEEFKTINSLELIYKKALEVKLERKDVIVALGGGVIGDVAGFAASSYLRGVDFIQVPTTILAQVDSSVGGKVAVNLESGKNLVGAFYQPKVVVQDINTLNTLDERQIKTGLAEVLKYAFIEKNCSSVDYNFFDFLKDNKSAILSLEKSILSKMINICCKLKAEIVSKDEKEQGLRSFLNFGHTFAHAIETLTQYKTFTHGEAVAIGMKMAFDLSLNRNLISKDYYDDALNLIDSFGLSYCLPDLNKEMFLSVMFSDKKVSDNKIKFVLPILKGKSDFFSDVSDEEIKKVIEKYVK